MKNRIDAIKAQIIVFSRLRDAVRKVAGTRVFRSVQHRDEVFMAIIEALESLEDELEDALSKEDEDAEQTSKKME